MRFLLVLLCGISMGSLAHGQWLSPQQLAGQEETGTRALDQGVARDENAVIEDDNREDTGGNAGLRGAAEFMKAEKGAASSELNEFLGFTASDIATLENLPSPDGTPRDLGWASLGAPLEPEQMEFAQTAWNYFLAATEEDTGLVRSTLKFPSTTMWDQGGYFLALVSAQRLGLLSRDAASERAKKAITSLSQLPLIRGRYPNKAYNTETLEMTDYANKPVPYGIGYSALDIMRLVSGMIALEQTYPEIAELSQRVRGKWQLENLVREGRFWSTTIEGEEDKGLRQEGRIGYEQYAGRVGMHVGLNSYVAVQYGPILRWQDYEGIRIPGDNRLAATHGVDPVTTSEPFILEALELGWRDELLEVSLAVFGAQLFRHRRTGHLTALSEDHIAGAPYFTYGGILVGTTPFQTVTPGRKVANDRRTQSSKASFGWWALTGHPYTEDLVSAVAHLQTDNGWQAGIFESDGEANTVITLNTNAVILEALYYRAFGPLIQNRR